MTTQEATLILSRYGINNYNDLQSSIMDLEEIAESIEHYDLGKEFLGNTYARITEIQAAAMVAGIE